MIELKNVTKKYGDFTAVDDISFIVAKGEVCVLIGPSGCGKSTTLKMINRMLEPNNGEIFVNARNVADFKPELLRRQIGYVIQYIGLFPHMTVSANIGIVPRLLSWNREIIEKRVDELLNLIGLDPAKYSEKYPHELSGGEAQRIRLASQIGSRLVGVLYILDEPSIGLHQRDNRKLLDMLGRLRDLGNTVIVVEHDEDVIGHADHIIDIGPAAGAHGGEVVATGSVKDICDCERSITGRYLSGRSRIELPATRRKYNMRNCLEVKQAEENNLKNIDVKFPVGVFTCVTGVSGSGKSTLVTEILLKSLKRRLYNSREKPGKHKRVLGSSHIDKVIEIDQSPIGRTPRSNPVTYTGVFDLVRQLFALTREAKIRGYKPGRFSFNVKGGRCEHCQGQGTKKIEMHYTGDHFRRAENYIRIIDELRKEP